MPFAETASGRLHYQVCDIVAPWVREPQTMVFHHGVAASLDIWAGWLPVLASRFRLVRFDMRGYGQSVVPPEDFRWSFDQLVDDTLAVADAAGAARPRGGDGGRDPDPVLAQEVDHLGFS